VEKLLQATLNIVRSVGEQLFIDVSRSYAYTLVAKFGNRKYLMKIAADAEDVSSSAIKDLKLLSKYTNVTSLCIVSDVKGQVLRRGVVYLRDNFVFMSLSTFTDILNGKEPTYRVSRGTITAMIDGKKLRELRERAGMSLSAVAEQLGVTRETVYRYERGEIEAPLRIAEKLVQMFGDDIIRKVDIWKPPELTQEELRSRRVADETYRLIESHPDAIKIEKRVVFVSTNRDKYEKTKELANALGVEVVKA
jgi:putative transcriptional regulator